MEDLRTKNKVIQNAAHHNIALECIHPQVKIVLICKNLLTANLEAGGRNFILHSHHSVY